MINYVNHPLGAGKEPNVVSQLIRIMKLTSFFLAIACLHVSASSLSQTITLYAKNHPMTTVFSAIEAQTGHLLVYNDQHVKSSQLVSVDVKNQRLKLALDQILTPQSLVYRVEGKTIAIRERTM